MKNDPKDLQYGFVAEEVEEVSKCLVAYDQQGNLTTVIYASIAPMLVNEIQKLKKIIDNLENKIALITKV